jgi:signal transduction histidine kinase
VVADQGMGIDADDTATLLAFAGRGRNADGVEGAGIGLYIARRIAEAHKGHIAIEPGEPIGTRVTIEVDRR